MNTILELFPGGPYPLFQFAAFADEVVVLPRSVPEPATLTLISLAFLGFALSNRLGLMESSGWRRPREGRRRISAP